ncbi:hypothetical protein M1146_02575 [Patescibacteria group bacterium]|nr:hypothetical protein [Patescibacteria group bacterium]
MAEGREASGLAVRGVSREGARQPERKTETFGGQIEEPGLYEKASRGFQFVFKGTPRTRGDYTVTDSFLLGEGHINEEGVYVYSHVGVEHTVQLNNPNPEATGEDPYNFNSGNPQTFHSEFYPKNNVEAKIVPVPLPGAGGKEPKVELQITASGSIIPPF